MGRKYRLTSLLFFFLAGFIPEVAAQFFPSLTNQSSRPVFRSKKDSINLYKTDGLLSEEMRKTPLNERRIDSLHQLRSRIYVEGVIGVKRIYKPTRGFITTDSLGKREDYSGISKICISGKNTIPDIVWKCKDLEILELINTHIDELPAALSAMPKLHTLNIYNNQSRRPLKLAPNSNIKNLTIQNGTPEGIPGSFRKLSGLVKLDLSENSMIKFPNGARRNKKLQELNLQRNAITLKNRIKRHPSLEKLALHGNDIARVPASIRNCRNLKKLNFNSNKITGVSRSIRKLKKLEQLSFYSNQLSAIPDGVYDIRSLLEIDLFHNQIEVISPRFIQWQALHTLYLSHNKLTALPENLDTLSSLSGLYVWDNRLGKLPDNIGEIRSLRFLRANNNYLKGLPDSITQLDSLQELDLSHNFIAELPEGIFEFRQLKILAVVNNPWNENTRQLLFRKAEELRGRDVFVHTSDTP